jgi:hypothetical protein
MYAALSDWSTGRYMKRNFTTRGYRLHYEHLLDGLKKFQILRPNRCAALMDSYSTFCKSVFVNLPSFIVLKSSRNRDAEVPEDLSEPKLRVCNTDTEDESD